MSSTTDFERGARVRFPPPLVLIACIGLGVVFQRAVTPLYVPGDRTIGLAVGVLLIAIAVGLIVSARILFVRTGQSPVPWKPSPELISGGPYRFTRNPMYLGMTLFELGLGAALNNLWISLFAPLALLIVHLIAVRPEERYLSEKFGEPYKAYLARVRRYL
jgi:protein-S-isoprenylcysteine O-methyltransferase Ste14